MALKIKPYKSPSVKTSTFNIIPETVYLSCIVAGWATFSTFSVHEYNKKKSNLILAKQETKLAACGYTQNHQPVLAFLNCVWLSN